MKLAPGESVVTAWAERCNGPGWSSQLVWLLVRTPAGYRPIGLQPAEWCKSPELCALFNISAVVTEDMTKAAKVLLGDETGLP